MKWQIAAEHREEFLKKQGRKGNQSSTPTSPAACKDNPNFRGANGQHLGYDRSYEGQFSAVNKNSPQTNSPAFNTFPVIPNEAYTPERGSRSNRRETNDTVDFEEQSPLPSRSRSNTIGHAYGLSDTAAGSPPTLSSSYYDHQGQAMITPAPRRQIPKLAPPSTAQVPSKFMPTSSPAPFWKMMEMGSTPARPVPDMSPLKANASNDNIPSSSPPGSPSKAGSSRQVKAENEEGPMQPVNGVAATNETNEDEEGAGGIDLTR